MAMVSVGINASRPLFWALPSLFQSRTAAAGAIALINALGNLGGIAGPTMLGWVKTATGSFSDGLYFLGACTFIAAIVVLVAVRAPSRVVTLQQLAHLIHETRLDNQCCLIRTIVLMPPPCWLDRVSDHIWQA
jgi:ACS family tartrate transporter-like MFS transporter